MIKLVADGAYSAKDDVGGWAFILVDEVKDRKLIETGWESPSTNNRMELIAVIKGFEDLHPSATFPGVEVISDSEYVIKGITKWIHGWKKGGWINSSREPVKNRELWEELDAITAPYMAADLIKWTHTRGHIGHEWNEQADKLAVEARLKGAGRL